MPSSWSNTREKLQNDEDRFDLVSEQKKLHRQLFNQSARNEVASDHTSGTRRRPQLQVTNRKLIITLDQINSKFSELVSNRSKISKKDIKELIYLDKNTEELGLLLPSSRSFDLKSSKTTRSKKRRRRNRNKHYDNTDNGKEQNLEGEIMILSPNEHKKSSAPNSEQMTSFSQIRASTEEFKHEILTIQEPEQKIKAVHQTPRMLISSTKQSISTKQSNRD